MFPRHIAPPDSPCPAVSRPRLTVSRPRPAAPRACLACAVLALLLALLPIAVAAQPAEAPASAEAPRRIGALRFIGEQRIAHRQRFQGTTVGGLSGIDYDPHTGDWALASDDRSDMDAARWYTARLAYDAQGFSAATLTAVTPFLQPDGTPYPGRLRGGRVPDVEAIRYDPFDHDLWYASEGDRMLGLDPVVRRMAPSGALLGELPVLPMFRTHLLGNQGPRNNLAFEGLAFAPDGKSLWVAMEAPTLQDGPVPTPASGAMARFTQYDRNGAPMRQVAYPVDPIPATPGPGRHADNGVSEILAVDARHLLVIERSAVQSADGKYTNYIRLYQADLEAASETGGIAALAGARFQPVAKRLVLDLNTLRLPRLDNIEGIAWGPKLANGHDSLVMVSDDNFNPEQITQLLAFEVLPWTAERHGNGGVSK